MGNLANYLLHFYFCYLCQEEIHALDIMSMTTSEMSDAIYSAHTYDN